MTASVLPRVRTVRAGDEPGTLDITWHDKRRTTVDLKGLIGRSKRLAALADPALFRKATRAHGGYGVAWPGGLDYAAASLDRLARLQQEMTGADLAHWMERLGLSIQETAALLGLSPRMIKLYRQRKAVPLPLVTRIACRLMEEDRSVLDALYRPRSTGRPRKAA